MSQGYDGAYARKRIEVSDGATSGLLFIASDSVVDEPLLYRGDDRFTGTLTLDLHERDWLEDGITVRGGMLQNSSALTGLAFQRGLAPLGDWGNYVVTLCVFLFAISTMISWSYYGDRCVTYLVGSKWVFPYRVVYTGFVYLGSVLALEVVWAYGDLSMGLMALPNLLAVILLMPKLLELTREYFTRMGSAAD